MGGAPQTAGPGGALQAQDVPVEMQQESLDPDEARRQELMQDEAFSKLVKLYKMRIPLLNLRNQMRAGGVYDPDDILLFASKSDIKALKALKDYTGDKYD